jgi:competence protein ComEA
MRNTVLLCGLLALWCVPARGEQTSLEGVVNLNTASPDELRLIPGVGPARVRNILAYRKAHPFRSVDELARIKGIGRKTVRKWRVHLAVAGPSTAQRVVRPDPPPVPPVEPQAKPPAVGKPMALPRPPVRPLAKPAVRRGEPVRALAVHAPGVHCLPPR